MRASLARSASVTRSTSPLYSVAHAAMIEVAQQGAGLACDGFRSGKESRPCYKPAPSSRTAARRRPAAATFGDGANLRLVDEEIRLALAGEAQHHVVEVFDPAADRLAVAQLDGDRDLAVAERFEVERFLPGFAGRRSFVTLLCRHG